MGLLRDIPTAVLQRGVFVVHKVQRNDPCPCGSGKKYKQCCMLKERDLAAVRAGNREVVQDAVNWISSQHGDALARWVEQVWFSGCDERTRQGIATADPSIKHIHDTNLLEYLIAEGQFEVGEEGEVSPVLQLLLQASLDLNDTQRDYLQQLGNRPLRLYRVTESMPGESFSLQLHAGQKESAGKDQAVQIEDKWISRMLDVGDTVGLRLMQTGGLWETSGAVYHIPDEYVDDLASQLKGSGDYSRTLIQYWLELVGQHV